VDEIEHVAGTGGIKRMQILIGKHVGYKLLGRPRRRWKDNIKMDFKNRI
jgi:hypothetical protein